MADGQESPPHIVRQRVVDVLKHGQGPGHHDAVGRVHRGDCHAPAAIDELLGPVFRQVDSEHAAACRQLLHEVASGRDKRCCVLGGEYTRDVGGRDLPNGMANE